MSFICPKVHKFELNYSQIGNFLDQKMREESKVRGRK